MIKKGLSLFCFLLLLAESQSAVTSNTNSTEMAGYCTGTPYWKLNLCNISCATCQSSDYTKCATCQNNFTLSSSNCKLSNDTYTFVYLSYFTSTSISTSEMSLWRDADANKGLAAGDIVNICSNATGNSYQFQMLGLFGINDDINYQVSFTDTFSYITLKFNLLLLVNSVTLYVKLGQQQVYSVSYNTLSDLTSTYYKSTNESTGNYLNIGSLTSSNVRTVVQEISVDLAVSTASIDLHILCSSPTATSFWGISDFTILMRECDTCTKSALMSEISSLGTVIGYTSAFLIPTLIIFVILIKIGEKIRSNKRERLLGGRSLPIKAIKRVINLISNIGKKKKDRSSTDNRKSRGFVIQLEPLKQQNLKLSKAMSMKQQTKQQ